jgi:hypothetical protein
MSASQGLAGFRICELLHLSVAKKTHPRSIKQRKTKIFIDADSMLTHLGESRRQIIASTEFCFPVLRSAA